MQILDKTSTGMHWHKHKDGSEIYAEYKEMLFIYAIGGISTEYDLFYTLSHCTVSFNYLLLL